MRLKNLSREEGSSGAIFYIFHGYPGASVRGPDQASGGEYIREKIITQLVVWKIALLTGMGTNVSPARGGFRASVGMLVPGTFSLRE